MSLLLFILWVSDETIHQKSINYCIILKIQIFFFFLHQIKHLIALKKNEKYCIKLLIINIYKILLYLKYGDITPDD